ncbi:hypothetical protein [Lacipirellula parvula]|uniref:hypothetical protein n=1 Tax=Lacipirellula parvula TaxID=2650471 RepID=UPI0015625789|nr:hypothetical protein [Lacipirellula parvula]
MYEQILSAFSQINQPLVVVEIRHDRAIVTHPDAIFDLRALEGLGEIYIGEGVIEIHF